MDLKQLREHGAFIQVPLVPAEVTWIHDDPATGEEMTDTFTVHIRRMSVGWLDRALRPTARGEQRSRTASLISEGIGFGEEGKEQMTYDEAYVLDPTLARVLMETFYRINERGGNDSTPKA